MAWIMAPIAKLATSAAVAAAPTVMNVRGQKKVQKILDKRKKKPINMPDPEEQARRAQRNAASKAKGGSRSNTVLTSQDEGLLG